MPAFNKKIWPPPLDPPHGPKPEFSGAGVSLHAALILQAYGAFGLSAVAALMYLTQEHNLKFNKLRAIVSLFPPIQRLENITARLLTNGFLLLTVGLSLGVLVLNGVALNATEPGVTGLTMYALLAGEVVLLTLIAWGRGAALPKPAAARLAPSADCAPARPTQAAIL